MGLSVAKPSPPSPQANPFNVLLVPFDRSTEGLGFLSLNGGSSSLMSTIFRRYIVSLRL